MNIQIIGGEEYEWGDERKKNPAGMSWDDACDVLDGLNDKDAEKLGFPSGTDDMWDFITKKYTITEE